MSLTDSMKKLEDHKQTMRDNLRQEIMDSLSEDYIIAEGIMVDADAVQAAIHYIRAVDSDITGKYSDELVDKLIRYILL